MEYKKTYNETKPVQQSTKPQAQSYGQKKLPEIKFRAGALSATVWNNDSKDKSGNPTGYMTICVERHYLDKEGKWQSTSSLRVNDLPKAALLLNKAYEYIVLKQNSYESSRISDSMNSIVQEEIVI